MGHPDHRISDDHFNKLIKDLHRRDWKLRLNAAKELGDIGTGAQSAVPHLVECLSDKNENVLATAIIAIGKIKPDNLSIIQPLIRHALSTSESVSKMAMHALSKIALKNENIIPALISALQEAPINDRCILIDILGTIGPLANDAVPVLFTILQQPLQADFSFHHVLAALDQIGPPKREDLHIILDLFKIKDGSIQLFRLPDFDEKDTVIRNHILPLFEESLDRFYHQHAQFLDYLCSAKIGLDELIPPLIQSLSHPDKFVRRYTTECFAYIGPQAHEAVPALIVALNDTYSEVRFYAAEALGYIGATAFHAIPALTEAKHDSDVTVQEAAESAINKIHSHTVN